MIEIDRVGDRIHLNSHGYDPRVVASCRKIPGRNWAKSIERWTFPLTIESCLLLRGEFGVQLKVRKSLSQWYAEEAAKREALSGLGNGKTAAELPRVKKLFPMLHEAVCVARPYQSIGARFVVEGRNVLIADDPGLGKTLVTLAGIAESGVPGPYLVVSPKTATTSVWGYEVPRWLPGHQAITLPEGRAKRDAILDGLREVFVQNGEGFTLNDTWLSIHPEAVLVKSWFVCEECGGETQYTRKPTPTLDCGHDKTKRTKRRDDATFPQLFDIEWGAIIVDECHDSLVMKSGTPTQRRNGLDLLRLRSDGLRVTLSGTPLRNKPWNLWSILNWMMPKTYSGKWRWIQQYWETGGYSGYEVQELIDGREQMLWNELKPIVLRRTKAEVAGDLPPKAYVGTPLVPGDETSPVGIWLDMESKQAKAYRQMVRNSAAEVEGGTLTASGTLPELTRLTQLASAYGTFDAKGNFRPFAPSNKLEWTRQFLAEMGILDGRPTGKVVITSRFTEMLEFFKRELKLNNFMSCTLTGDASAAKRKAMIDGFNEPVGSASPHVMFLQVKAGGVAITIDSADDMVMIDESDPDTMIQVEDRIHRVSNPRNVRYHYLRSVGTVDVAKALVNQEVAAGSRRLLDERRGVGYERRILEVAARAG